MLIPLGGPELNVLQDGAAVIASGSPVNLPSFNVGSSASQSFTINNTGEKPLIFSAPAVSVVGEDAEMFSVTTNVSGALPPGGAATMTVSFAPGGLGEKRATLSIGSNDADEPSLIYSWWAAA